MAKVIVTGGAGFIGSHIVDALIANGDEVLVIDDLSSGNLDNLSIKATFEQCDIRAQGVKDVIKSFAPDVLIHAAAQISVRVSMENPAHDVDVNLVGLLNILSAFDPSQLPYICFISTGGAMYGDQEVFPAPEDHIALPTSVYGMSKRASELYLDMWKRVYGLKFASLRLANVYGPRQNPHGEAGVVAIFSKTLLASKTPVINGSGGQTRDFVYVGDVAKAVVAAHNKRVEGIFNIGTGAETSVNELYANLLNAAASEIPAVYAPAKAGEQLRSSIDSSKAKKVFGWTSSVPLSEGIQRTIDFFKTQQ